MPHLQFPAKKTKQASCFDSIEAGGKKSFQTVRLVLGEVVAQRLYRKWRWFLQILCCVDAQIWRAALNCDLHQRYQSLSRKRRSWLAVLLWHSDSDSTTCGWFKTSNLNKCSSWQSREALASKLGTCFLLDLFSKSETSRYLAQFLATSMHLVFYWSGSKPDVLKIRHTVRISSSIEIPTGASANKLTQSYIPILSLNVWNIGHFSSPIQIARAQTDSVFGAAKGNSKCGSPAAFEVWNRGTSSWCRSSLHWVCISGWRPVQGWMPIDINQHVSISVQDWCSGGFAFGLFYTFVQCFLVQYTTNYVVVSF